jgi:hypothetical protein
MIIVHDVFICKPGNASKIAKLFKEWADVVPKKNVQVMTDMTGSVSPRCYCIQLRKSFCLRRGTEDHGSNTGRTEGHGKVQRHE